MSIRLPGRANGGRVAVTMTAATFFGRKASPLTLTPSRSSRFASASSVKGAFRIPSPVPASPTTRP